MAFDVKTQILTNWPMKVTALALAAVLWAAVATREPTTQMIDVTLVIQAPPGKVVVGAPKSVQALFSGSAGEIFKLYFTPPFIRKAVPENYADETFTVDLSPSDLTVDTDAAVSAMDVRPRRLEVTLDSLTQRTLPVGSQITIEPDSGYRRDDITFRPDSVTVTGPHTLVAELSEIRTSPWHRDGVRKSIEESIPLDTTGLTGITLDQNHVIFSAAVSEVATESKMLANVPVQVVARRGVWTSESPYVVVTVTGPSDRLGRITRDSVRVTAGPLGTGPRETVLLEVYPPEGFSVRLSADSVVVIRRDRGA